MEHKCYILVNGEVKEVDTKTWAAWTESRTKSYDPAQVAYTKISDKINVSTMFLQLNHNWKGKGTPIFFETMVFGGKHDGYMRRYQTLAEAELGHLDIVETLKHEQNL